MEMIYAFNNQQSTINPQPPTPSFIIYFDGVCNLCQGSVQFILRRDNKRLFRFASFQGKSGQDFIHANNLQQEQFETFILKEGEKIYTRSTAALKVARHLGGIWRLLFLFIIVPRFIRDAIYDNISKNRYRWFGKKEDCWIPEPKWENRFLP
jgi:predicted DCC family thiol-disulfide oxidoreductase YuxK